MLYVEFECSILFIEVIEHLLTTLINSLPYNKILDWSKLKAFADDKINRSKKLKFVLGRVEHIVGKGENTGF